MVTKRTIKTIFKIRRAREREWEELNPLLALGEPGYAYDVEKLKIGNGVDYWRDLPYLNESLPEIIDAVKELSISDFSDGADYATKEYVDINGGKINSISVNGVLQPIDENKNVDLTVSLSIYRAGNGINIDQQNVISVKDLIIDCGTGA